MTLTSREILTAHFQALQNEGLKDLKFFLGTGVTESTVEDVCAVVNRVYDEVAKGNVVIQDSWNDSQKPTKAA